jgi:hypothetical protein
MPHDPVRGVWIALGAVALLAILLAVLFSSPDERPSTIAQWSRQQPISFLGAAVFELYGSSHTAEYGPPYNRNGDGQHAAFLHPQEWLGVSHPIDTAKDFVIEPLRALPDPAVRHAIAEYQSRSGIAKEDGIRGYLQALQSASVTRDGSVAIRPGFYENVDKMMRALLVLAQNGVLEAHLLASGRSRTDYTKPLLFMADGGLLRERAEREHLLSGQWPMMDETGSYPGQAWLWPYAIWYQIEPFRTSNNADILVMLVMFTFSVLLVCIPFLPGLRDIPRALPLHRLIWKTHPASH